MNTQRIGRIPYHGKGICRGCQGPVPKGRKTWCSQGCVDEALIRKGDPSVVRRHVLARDKGICAGCGLDCARAQRVLDYLSGRIECHYGEAARSDRSYVALAFLREHWTGSTRSDSSLWQADHIVPVIEGGGGCGLDGYRTLCCRCHKAETRALAARRAKQRREQLAVQQRATEAERLALWTGVSRRDQT